jgi:hypothetical protein
MFGSLFSTSPYDGGYRAWCDDGASFYQNPHEEGTDAHAKWADGWREALKEDRHERIREECRRDRVTAIEVLSSGDDRVCGPCQERDGKLFAAKEAIENPPIPHENCEGGYCRCVFIVPDEGRDSIIGEIVRD